MYCLSRMITSNDSVKNDYGDITYQAAEDHDIGGSHEFPEHILRMSGGDLDVTSSKTCFSSEVDTSSSREVLQACQSHLSTFNITPPVAMLTVKAPFFFKLFGPLSL